MKNDTQCKAKEKLAGLILTLSMTVCFADEFQDLERPPQVGSDPAVKHVTAVPASGYFPVPRPASDDFPIPLAASDDFSIRLSAADDLSIPLAASADSGESSPDDTSAECLKLTADINADVGEILRAGCQPTTAQMAKLMDNPLGNVAMMLNQYDFIGLKNSSNDEKRWQGNLMTILQFPTNLSDNWNVINRIVFNVPSVPVDQNKLDQLGVSGSMPPGSTTLIDAVDGRTNGFGDMYYVGLFSPKKPIEFDNLEGKLVWGAGFDLGFPTASKEVLGAGKYTAGPAALAAYLGPKWKVGGLVQQYFDYAGDKSADDVNLTNLQYLYYYSLSPTLSIGAAPNILVNWEQSNGNRLTLPLGIGINKTINIGKVPVRFGLEFHYSVVRPNDIPGSTWDVRLNIIPAVASALIPFMSKQVF